MREEIANAVYAVFNYGLNLKDRLDRGENPDLAQEQRALKGYLDSDMGARRLPDFAGDSVTGTVGPGGLRPADAAGGRRSGEAFLGIRYALTCWVDEIFIADSPWADLWKEEMLEYQLYGTNDRAWNFWEQARLAETRPGGDALEVFFLCAMLGFRGKYRDEPESLRKWVNGIQVRLARALAKEWPAPPSLNPPIHVPRRRSRRAFQRVLGVAAGVLLLVIALGTFALINGYSR
jgi:type VI secretion system protein ImpK